jgi:hypothetical protein
MQQSGRRATCRHIQGKELGFTAAGGHRRLLERSIHATRFIRPLGIETREQPARVVCDTRVGVAHRGAPSPPLVAAPPPNREAGHLTVPARQIVRTRLRDRRCNGFETVVLRRQGAKLPREPGECRIEGLLL